MRGPTSALAQAKAEIRALVERDFNHGAESVLRFMEDHTGGTTSDVVVEVVGDGTGGGSHIRLGELLKRCRVHPRCQTLCGRSRPIQPKHAISLRVNKLQGIL